MKLLSKELVSLEYRDMLRSDLARAKVCRFLVAYISDEGLKSIGRHLLIQAFRDERSFGVASLSCACGYEPLVGLQSSLPETRLKYFMDPLEKEWDEPEITLFHSKLVYLWLERDAKSVVYIGSHNWSGRALGPGQPRNAEASMRFELEFLPEDLNGTGISLASEINKHLLDAWNLPPCLPATAANQPTFDDWYQKGCRKATAAPVEDVTIILTVLKNTGQPPQPEDWQKLEGGGIYFQVFEEREGQTVWDSSDRILVLVWDSEAALQSAEQPIILKCRKTTSNAGKNPQKHGTNQSTSPISGFKAVILDERRLAAEQKSSSETRGTVKIWSGRAINVYDFEFPTQRNDSMQVDGNTDPKYQFYLEVDHAVFPANRRWPFRPKLMWERETFAVAAKKDSARMEEKPGYRVEPEQRDQIMKSLRDTFYVDPNKARVLPVSEFDHHRVGKRVSKHPLHEAYIGMPAMENRDEFYAKSKPQMLVAEIDPDRDDHQKQKELSDKIEPLPRVHRVFAMPMKDLLVLWQETAAQHEHPG